MKIPFSILISYFCLVAFLTSGCASLSTDMDLVSGGGINDLKNARSADHEQIFSMTSDAAFEKVKAILIKDNLTIFQSSKEKGYIVAMGFPKQNNTTRVAIFFESIESAKTKVTISSLSTSATMQAEALIFRQLSS